MFGVGKFDDPQPSSLEYYIFDRLFTAVTQVNESNLNVITRNPLNLLG